MERISLSLLRHDVSHSGFHLFDWHQNAPLESLARRVGRPVASVPGRPTVDVLVPKTREDSEPGLCPSSMVLRLFHFIPKLHTGRFR